MTTAPEPCSARRHGTRSAHEKHRCQCPEAVAAAQAAWAAHNRRRREDGRRRLAHHVDDIAVERASYGDPVRLNRAERRKAVALLTRQGLTKGVIAERLRISPRAVARWRRSSASAESAA